MKNRLKVPIEKLTKIIVQIEAIMNSRPITTISNDPHNPITLTSAHFVIGDLLAFIPENHYTTVSDNFNITNYFNQSHRIFGNDGFMII